MDGWRNSIIRTAVPFNILKLALSHVPFECWHPNDQSAQILSHEKSAYSWPLYKLSLTGSFEVHKLWHSTHRWMKMRYNQNRRIRRGKTFFFCFFLENNKVNLKITFYLLTLIGEARIYTIVSPKPRLTHFILYILSIYASIFSTLIIPFIQLKWLIKIQFTTSLLIDR